MITLTNEQQELYSEKLSTIMGAPVSPSMIKSLPSLPFTFSKSDLFLEVYFSFIASVIHYNRHKPSFRAITSNAIKASIDMLLLHYKNQPGKHFKIKLTGTWFHSFIKKTINPDLEPMDLSTETNKIPKKQYIKRFRKPKKKNNEINTTINTTTNTISNPGNIKADTL